jgi:hypothetical protein
MRIPESVALGTPEADYWWKELRPTWWRREGNVEYE